MGFVNRCLALRVENEKIAEKKSVKAMVASGAFSEKAQSATTISEPPRLQARL